MHCLNDYNVFDNSSVDKFILKGIEIKEFDGVFKILENHTILSYYPNYSVLQNLEKCIKESESDSLIEKMNDIFKLNPFLKLNNIQ